jgi:hypothetical protein
MPKARSCGGRESTDLVRVDLFVLGLDGSLGIHLLNDGLKPFLERHHAAALLLLQKCLQIPY